MQVKLEHFLNQFHIRDGRILVGVSGGADSVALLRGLKFLAESRRLELVVGHFDHALREDSADDARWVESLSATLGICSCMERNPHTRDSKTSLPEATARSLRYDFFQRIAIQEQCRWVAVAHTADDQVETILHHIVRGSGLKGVCGIPATRVLGNESQTVTISSPRGGLSALTRQKAREPLLLVRPLLQVWRTELLTCLDSMQQSYCTDSTNTDCGYTRNRIRHEILPLLRTKLNPRVDEALLRLAQQATDAQAAMTALVHEWLPEAILDRQPHSVRLNQSSLQGRSIGVLREFFGQLWQLQEWPRQDLSFEHLHQLAEMVAEYRPHRLSLPGHIEAISRGRVFELRRD